MPAEPNHEYRHTAERLQELEAKVVELQEANEAQKRVNRSYMERIFTLEGQYQKLQDEQRQQLDRIASLERSLAEHRDWHIGVEQRISEQRTGIVRRKKLSATREDTTS